jgi:hypothetical protein
MLMLMWLIGGGLQLSNGGTFKPQPNRRFSSRTYIAPESVDEVYRGESPLLPSAVSYQPFRARSFVAPRFRTPNR